MSAAAPPPAVPGYQLERLLGRGGFCQVWLAREEEGLRRPVALKLFPGSGETWRRELDAARAVEELRRESRCPHLVQSLGAGEAQGLAFIAYEWLEEGTLEERVARAGPLPFAEALELVRQAGEALRLLHQGGVFHRDVKPGNLLLGRDGRVRLADYGLSRPLAGTLSAAGSPAFAAPEAIAGRPQDGQRLDVYSLGATLAWLLSGETMLPGRPDVFLLERHGVPRSLQAVIVRAMACDPQERTPTIERLLAELTQPIAAPAPPALLLAPASAPTSEPEPELAPAHEDHEARRRRAWAVVERTGYAAAAVTTLPIPGSEWLAALPLQVTMTVGVGQVYGCRLEREGAVALLRRIAGTVGLSYLGSRALGSVAKLLLPGVGGLAGAALMYASTLALGGVVIAWFEREGELGEEEMRAVYGARLREARGRFDPARAVSLEESARPGSRPGARGRREQLLRFAGRLARLEQLLEAGLISAADHAATAERILAEELDPGR